MVTPKPMFRQTQGLAGLHDITFQSMCVLSSAVLGYDGNDFLGTGEMARWLGTSVVFAQDPWVWFPAHTWWFTTD